MSNRQAPPHLATSLREPAIIVISGIQGAGKTTVADLLARRFDRAARVSGDAMQHMLVSGGQWPDAREPAPEAARQLRLRLHNACLLARSFQAGGFTAIVDDIIIGDRLDHLRAELAGQDFYFVMLTPNLEAIRQREHGRGTALYEQWSWMNELTRTRAGHGGLWLDSTHQTAEQTADELWRRLPEALVQPRVKHG